MNTNKQHIIQKQVVEVEMENPADAFQFRNRLGEVFNEKILPGLEKLFDELGGNGKTIRVDKLEADIGSINVANWEDELRQKAIKKIREILLEQDAVWVSPASASEETDTFDQQIRARKNNPLQQELSQQFIYFLQTGRLPWHADSNIVFEKELVNQLTPAFIAALKKMLAQGDATAITRLIYQLSDQLLFDMLCLLLPQYKDGFLLNFQQANAFSFNALRSVSAPDYEIRLLVFRPAFNYFSCSNGEEPSNFYSSAFAALMQEKYPGIQKAFQLNTAPAQYRANEILQWIEKDFASVKVKKQLTDFPLREKKEDNITEGIFVENAGLVMLHPFFPSLFAQLNLLEKSYFINEAAQMKAALLLQLLVNGSTAAEEHQLVLNKLLCGISPELPFIKQVVLTEEEKAEAQDLLNQVIAMWTKSSTPVNGTVEGLQQSFLQRRGKLVQQENNWYLTVEQKAYDMLLSSLPWGISIIKNNWMAGMMRVEWG